ncbi:MAG: DNA topology modulation protein [Clostridia bacterium]|nr:DNA topology modulation protein [Clostridia bacterium]
MKISVIGYSGGGKSTLAELLGKHYGLETVHLDRFHFLPNWVERSTEEMLSLVETFLNSHDEWVIDGNYKKCAFQRRMEESDLIIFFNFNRFTCFYRALKRYFHYKGKSRSSMTEGCNEKMDWAFIKWLLFEGRQKRRRKFFENVVKDYPEKVVVLKNQRQLSAYANKVMKLEKNSV